MSQPIPNLVMDVPTPIFINQSFPISVTFSNIAATTIGFLPAFDIVLPFSVSFLPSITSLAHWNGITWISTASGLPITNYPEFPFATIPTTGLSVGDQLFDFVVPHSSYGPTQEPLTFNFTLIVLDPSFTIGKTYNIKSYGIFFLGSAPTIPPGIPTFQPTVTTTISPVQFAVLKYYHLPVRFTHRAVANNH
jgi:hypothetical protein